MTISDGTIDRIEAALKELAVEVNRTSASTRNGWVFFLALQAYFFVALAGITHRDLLLDTPISLPLLQVPIGLKEFFLFGPIILVLVHMGILLQHVMLARQARELHSRLSSFEGKSFFRTHRIRIHLHSYFFTQLIAGGQRSAFFAFFLSLMTWLSLGILPVVLLLDFQTTFLPYHDLQVTWGAAGVSDRRHRHSDDLRHVHAPSCSGLRRRIWPNHSGAAHQLPDQLRPRHWRDVLLHEHRNRSR
jgi:hypothetical protein